MAEVFRDHLLQGKTAFITGGGSGINLRIAERFAEHGVKLVLIGRKQEKLDDAAARIRAVGGVAMGIAGDVRYYEDCENALRKATAEFGPIDILVCGAAGNFPAPVLGMSANGFKAAVDIDLLGTFNTCRAAYEYLRKPGASIVSISATHAFMPIAYQSHVCAAKAGVDMFSKTLAIEWAAVGIRVNVIAPGAVDDTEGMRRLAPTEQARRQAMQSVPLGRFGTKDEIADLALFLCSDAAAYITGAICVCDGGQSLLGSGRFLASLDAEPVPGRWPSVAANQDVNTSVEIVDAQTLQRQHVGIWRGTLAATVRAREGRGGSRTALATRCATSSPLERGW
jgi:NAD(P)-dependent dehydrogenase (short-subunit alcohol dehydrogenase family)